MNWRHASGYGGRFKDTSVIAWRVRIFGRPFLHEIACFGQETTLSKVELHSITRVYLLDSIPE